MARYRLDDAVAASEGWAPYVEVQAGEYVVTPGKGGYLCRVWAAADGMGSANPDDPVREALEFCRENTKSRAQYDRMTAALANARFVL